LVFIELGLVTFKTNQVTSHNAEQRIEQLRLGIKASSKKKEEGSAENDRR